MRYFTLLFLLLAMSLAVAGEYRAHLEPGRQLALGTLVSGVVGEVRVQPGQMVRQGELLLQLDQREFLAQQRRAQSRLARAESLLGEALREENRARELYDRTLLSDHEMQKARIGRLEAEARKQDAAAELVQAKLNLERSRVIAPVDGRILEVLAWQGQPLQNALEIQPLLVLAAVDALKLTLLLPERPRIDAVQVLVGDQWRQAAGFVLRPVAGEESSWRLDAWVKSQEAEPGMAVRVRLE
ncbi:efflux RND transporter periplasmic adaptor subunit [Thiolapillus sp.]